jgi:uncharacterized membrane protein YgcG
MPRPCRVRMLMDRMAPVSTAEVAMGSDYIMWRRSLVGMRVPVAVPLTVGEVESCKPTASSVDDLQWDVGGEAGEQEQPVDGRNQSGGLDDTDSSSDDREEQPISSDDRDDDDDDDDDDDEKTIVLKLPKHPVGKSNVESELKPRSKKRKKKKVGLFISGGLSGRPRAGRMQRLPPAEGGRDRDKDEWMRLALARHKRRKEASKEASQQASKARQGIASARKLKVPSSSSGGVDSGGGGSSATAMEPPATACPSDAPTPVTTSNISSSHGTSVCAWSKTRVPARQQLAAELVTAAAATAAAAATPGTERWVLLDRWRGGGHVAAQQRAQEAAKGECKRADAMARALALECALYVRYCGDDTRSYATAFQQLLQGLRSADHTLHWLVLSPALDGADAVALLMDAADGEVDRNTDRNPPTEVFVR